MTAAAAGTTSMAAVGGVRYLVAAPLALGVLLSASMECTAVCGAPPGVCALPPREPLSFLSSAVMQHQLYQNSGEIHRAQRLWVQSDAVVMSVSWLRTFDTVSVA